MSGDDRVRHCAKCQTKVFNLLGLSRVEVDALLSNSGAPVCARLFQRKDGMVMTRDCPTGLRRARLMMGAALSTAVALLFVAFVRTPASCGDSRGGLRARVAEVENQLRDVPVVGAVLEFIDPAVRPVMGKVVRPTPTGGGL